MLYYNHTIIRPANQRQLFPCFILNKDYHASFRTSIYSGKLPCQSMHYHEIAVYKTTGLQ